MCWFLTLFVLLENFRERVAKFGVFSSEPVFKNDCVLYANNKVPEGPIVLLTERRIYLPLCGLPFL